MKSHFFDDYVHNKLARISVLDQFKVAILQSLANGFVLNNCFEPIGLGAVF